MNKQERAERLNEMRHLYFEKDWTLGQLAAYYNVTPQAVYEKFNYYGVKLQKKKRKPAKTLEQKILSKLYEQEKLSAREISNQLEMPYWAVLRELKRHGIERRSRGWVTHKYPAINKLKIGESLTAARPSGKGPHRYFYYYANAAGIKVSVKSIGEETLVITRIE